MASRPQFDVAPGLPVRMCVGCRGRAAKPELLRVVGRGSELVPDPAARLPGRGAYIHPSQSCLELAQRRNAFGRALRLPESAGAGELRRYLAEVTAGAVHQARAGGVQAE